MIRHIRRFECPLYIYNTPTSPLTPPLPFPRSITIINLPLLKALLPLSRIPIQRSRNTINPVLAPSPLLHHVGKRVPRCGYRDIVAGAKLYSVNSHEEYQHLHMRGCLRRVGGKGKRCIIIPLPSIEARPARRPRIIRHAYPQNDCVG